MGIKDHVRHVNQEQARQIEKHKWIVSQKAGKDLSEEAVIEWIVKYASSFRVWAESIPFNCVKCGQCPGCNEDGECSQPFNEERLRRLKY